MIPTLIMIGMAGGRWWRWVPVVGGIAWGVVLVAGDVVDVGWGLAGAVTLGVANVALGVLLHQGVRWLGASHSHRRATASGA